MTRYPLQVGSKGFPFEYKVTSELTHFTLTSHTAPSKGHSKTTKILWVLKEGCTILWTYAGTKPFSTSYKVVGGRERGVENNQI